VVGSTYGHNQLEYTLMQGGISSLPLLRNISFLMLNLLKLLKKRGSDKSMLMTWLWNNMQPYVSANFMFHVTAKAI